jgi:hypothetical protein
LKQSTLGTFVLGEGMEAFLEFVRANPWPVFAAVLTLTVMVLSQFIGNGGDRTECSDVGGD